MTNKVFDNPETGYREHWKNNEVIDFAYKDSLTKKRPRNWPRNKWQVFQKSFLYGLGPWKEGKEVEV